MPRLSRPLRIQGRTEGVERPSPQGSLGSCRKLPEPLQGNERKIQTPHRCRRYCARCPISGLERTFPRPLVLFSRPMISKDRRLVEREIRKVLKHKKPFFSYSLVANVSENRVGFPRFAAIFSGKSVRCAVSRNFFRRRAYELARPYLRTASSADVVLVPKKGLPLNHRDASTVRAFEADVSHLYAKIFSTVPRRTNPSEAKS